MRFLITALFCICSVRAEKIPPIVVAAPYDGYIVLGDPQYMMRAAACTTTTTGITSDVALSCISGDGGPAGTNLHHMISWIVANISTYRLKLVICVGDITDANTA